MGACIRNLRRRRRTCGHGSRNRSMSTPEIITDRDGRASITIPIADNITTWRMAMLASTRQGALGSGTSSLKVFQDFFTEMDLPVTLTQGDEVSIPVAIYNYAGSRGNVRLRLEPGDWFAAEGDSLEKVVPVESGRVGAAEFRIAAKRIGKFKLTLRAEMEGAAKRADIVVREIEVVPNGREQSIVFNGRLDAVAQHTVSFPPNAIPESGTVFVRLYPGPLSQVVEGMDSLLRMPGGCFEQTSSSTYPNVLALDYMKRTKKLTPEIHAKAEGYIANGYQRLLTFEVPGGGFSWFGSAPANKILTSYGLMEFSDMAKVHDVDERVIQRTQQWLARQQQPDGSWRPDASFINEGATNRYNSDVLRITAYIAWALEATGYQGPAVDNAKRYMESHLPATASAGRVHAGRAGELRHRLHQRPGVHGGGDAAADRRANGAGRSGVVEERGDRHVCNRRECGGRDDGARGAGAAEAGKRKRGRGESDELHRRQERRRGHLGKHAGDHHGAARDAAGRGERRRDGEGRGGGAAERQGGRSRRADCGEQRPAASVRIQRCRFACGECGGSAVHRRRRPGVSGRGAVFHAMEREAGGRAAFDRRQLRPDACWRRIRS